jgi:hypothetical protein
MEDKAGQLVPFRQWQFPYYNHCNLYVIDNMHEYVALLVEALLTMKSYLLAKAEVSMLCDAELPQFRLWSYPQLQTTLL